MSDSSVNPKESTPPSPEEIKKPRRRRVKGDVASLVSPEGIGGIIGGGGYDFQKRYITCRIVEWLINPQFQELLHEGFGDADVRYRDDQAEWREHIQIKDHQVDVSEFREVLSKFVALDTKNPKLYSRFTLACQSLIPELKRLNRSLDRLRGVGNFFGSESDALEPTESAIRAFIVDVLKLDDFADFILRRLNFDTDLHSYHHDEKACTTFIGYLLRQPAYLERFKQVADPAYTMLLREVEGRRGKTFGRVAIEALLDKAALQAISLPGCPMLSVTIHNWAQGKYDTTPDHELDWCEHFERRIRRVPSPETWRELVPHITSIERAFLADKGAGVLRFRGACCLTTGLAVGNVFREVSGWIIEMFQSQTNAMWRSDAEPTIGYQILTEAREMDTDGDSIAVLLNIKGDGIFDVEEYLKESGVQIKALVTMEPPSAPGSLSIRNDGDAIAFANQARDMLQQLRRQHRTRMIHLFFFGPQALAVFLGNRLTSIGPVQLYEFQDPGYVPSYLLRT